MSQQNEDAMFHDYRDLLLDIARSAIERGLAGQSAWPVPGKELDTLPDPLHWIRATFVTLQIEQALRGCIGSMSATRPVAEDVAVHACAAAFQDPRFEPLTQNEWARTTVSISILSPLQSLDIDSEAELLSQLRPSVDGILLEEGHRHATFLPSVWEELPDPHSFLRHLKNKGGWPTDYWSSEMRVYRYTTEQIGP